MVATRDGFPQTPSKPFRTTEGIGNKSGDSADREAACLNQTGGELLDRCQKGDRESFDELVARHRQGLFRAAYGMLLNEADAEDATQDAFIRAYRSIRRCDPRRGFEGWLYAILINRCRTRAKAKGREATRSDPDVDGSSASAHEDGPGDLAERNEVREKVQKAIARLPKRQRAALVLLELQGWRVAEVAQIMGCSVGAVKAHLHSARAHLRRELSGILDQEERST